MEEPLLPSRHLRAGDRVVSLGQALRSSEIDADRLSSSNENVIETFHRLHELRDAQADRKHEDALTDALAEATELYAEAMGDYAFDLCVLLDYFHSNLDSTLPGKIKRVGAEIGKESMMRHQASAVGERLVKPRQGSFLLRLAESMERLQELQEFGLDPRALADRENSNVHLEQEAVEALERAYEERRAQGNGDRDNDIIRDATTLIVEQQVVSEHALMYPPGSIDTD